jgi:GMP synthase-like glutamine amidotransferase
MTLLATSEGCANQAVRLGGPKSRAYGLQFHPELTRKMLREWVHMDTDLRDAGVAEGDLINKYNSQALYAELGETLMINFLEIAELL